MGKFLGLVAIFVIGVFVGSIITSIGKETLLEMKEEQEDDNQFWDEEIAKDFDARSEDDLK